VQRLTLLLLAILIPVQLAWASAHSVRGHSVDGAGYHVHEDAGSSTPAEDEHSAHYHPVLTFVIALPASQPERILAFAAALPPLDTFASHTPALFDRPPAALA
jgi:hypothetical protein